MYSKLFPNPIFLYDTSRFYFSIVFVLVVLFFCTMHIEGIENSAYLAMCNTSLGWFLLFAIAMISILFASKNGFCLFYSDRNDSPVSCVVYISVLLNASYNKLCGLWIYRKPLLITSSASAWHSPAPWHVLSRSPRRSPAAPCPR